MNLREALSEGRDSVDSSDFLMGVGWLAVMLTFGNFILLTFAFGDQLTAEQLETVMAFPEIGVYLLAGFPVIAFLGGFVEAFELRSDDGDGGSEAEDAEADEVRFERTEDGYEESDAEEVAG